MPLKTERSLWAIYVMLRKILFKQDLKWGHARLISIFVQFLSYMKFQEIRKSEMRRNEHPPFSAEEKIVHSNRLVAGSFSKTCLHNASAKRAPDQLLKPDMLVLSHWEYHQGKIPHRNPQRALKRLTARFPGNGEGDRSGDLSPSGLGHLLK